MGTTSMEVMMQMAEYAGEASPYGACEVYNL